MLPHQIVGVQELRHSVTGLRVPCSGGSSAEVVPVSVVIPTLNEAAHIAGCICSVPWAGEVLVVDGGSTDGTRKVASEFGARVLSHPGATIGGQRNEGVGAAKYPWVFALDADERADVGLAEEIRRAIAEDQEHVYQIRRRNHFLGQEMRFGGWGSDWVVRLFPGRYKFSERRVHESLRHTATVCRLNSTITHNPYRSLADFKRKMDRYSAWFAMDEIERGSLARVSKLVTRPLARFLRMICLQGAFLDGWRGILLAWLSALSVFHKYRALVEVCESRQSADCNVLDA